MTIGRCYSDKEPWRCLAVTASCIPCHVRWRRPGLPAAQAFRRQRFAVWESTRVGWNGTHTRSRMLRAGLQRLALRAQLSLLRLQSREP
jgi:hypothetical protein